MHIGGDGAELADADDAGGAVHHHGRAAGHDAVAEAHSTGKAGQGFPGRAVAAEAEITTRKTDGAGAVGVAGVVCGRGRNPTLRFRPSVFAGEIDVLPAERRDMGQEIGR